MITDKKSKRLNILWKYFSSSPTLWILRFLVKDIMIFEYDIQFSNLWKAFDEISKHKYL